MDERLKRLENYVPNMDNIKNMSVDDIRRPVEESISQVVNNVNTASNTIRENVSQTFNDFSARANNADATTEFLQSNTVVAKFAFVLFVLLLFLFLFNLGIKLINYFTNMNTTPYLVKGVIEGNNSLTIPQNPRNDKAVTILRSNNAKTGVEFTWSTWLYISNTTTADTPGKKYYHIFNKGDGSYDASGLSTNNCPGLYLTYVAPGGSTPSANASSFSLKVVIDTEEIEKNPSQSLEISNIPLNKWFHLCIRCQNIVADVYVNGTNSARLIMASIPRQNYNDVNVCKNGGFVGKLSDLRYYSRALTVFEIGAVVRSGPNLSASKSSNTSQQSQKGDNNYLSQLWYMNHIMGNDGP